MVHYNHKADSSVIYNGEQVKIFATEKKDEVLVVFTNTITAYNKIKRAEFLDKGKLNCAIASKMFEVLENQGVPTHFIKQTGECEMLCRRVDMIQLEVIVRNVIAGSMSHRFAIEEGTRPANVIYELCYNDDDMSDPLINDHHAVALGLVSYDELKTIYALTEKINVVLCEALKKVGIELVDFKIQFGRLGDGTIVLADEVTPDAARLWDLETGNILDKDRFRKDLGHVGDAYREVLQRISTL